MTSDNQDNDRLADLLSEMADGRHAEPEDEAPQEHEEEHEPHVDSETSEQPVAGPAEQSPAAAAHEPAPSEPAATPANACEVARETDAAIPTTPPPPRAAKLPRPARSAAPPSPGRARPSAPVAPILGGDIDTPIDPTTADVAVPAQAAAPAASTPATPAPARRIVPAVTPARPPASRLYTQQQFRLIQAIAFKRTLIPILLTTGVLCLASVLLGWISSSESPFSAFRSLLFTVPMILIGLVLLFFGGLTMLQVKHDLIRTAPSPPPASHPQAQ